mmetsp:Transcript_32871/g.75089  ORF Transcript_32871/g.75089 Transcript_32871/m.75089 type:complete len:564 (-) Transcript_32871:408-2099(-)
MYIPLQNTDDITSLLRFLRGRLTRHSGLVCCLDHPLFLPILGNLLGRSLQRLLARVSSSLLALLFALLLLLELELAKLLVDPVQPALRLEPLRVRPLDALPLTHHLLTLLLHRVHVQLGRRRRVPRPLARRADTDEHALGLGRADLVAAPSAQHGLLEGLLGLHHDGLGDVRGQAPDEVGELLLQSQDEALVSGVRGVELEHLAQEGAYRRPTGYPVVLDVERVEGVVVAQGGREGAGALDPDVVVPEAEGLEGVVVPREGGGQGGRALGSDVVLAEEEFLDRPVELEHVRDVTRADVRDVIPRQPDLRHDPVLNQRVAKIPYINIVQTLGLEPHTPEVRARLGELVEQVLAEVRPGRLLVVGEGARQELAEAVEEVVLEPRRGDGEGRLGRGGVRLGQAQSQGLRRARSAAVVAAAPVGAVGGGHLPLVPEPPYLALVRGLARVRVALAPARRGLELVPLPSPHDRPGAESVAALRGVGPVLRDGLVGVEQGAGRGDGRIFGPVGRRLYRGGRQAAAVHGVLEVLLAGRRVERGEVDVVHRRFLVLARRVGRRGRGSLLKGS